MAEHCLASKPEGFANDYPRADSKERIKKKVNNNLKH